MKRRFIVAIAAALLVLGVSSPVFAAEGAIDGQVWIFFGLAALGGGLAIGIAAAGAGVGMGNALNAALTGTARNPEVSGKIMTNMIIGMALIESLGIYALVISLMIVLKIPSFSDIITNLLG
jgi:ATP synthase, F0 subunit c